MSLIFLTTAEMPTLLPYDQLVISKLQARNIEVDVLDWEKLPQISSEKLGSYHAIVTRTCWNYYKKPDVYKHFLEFCQSNQLPLLNPVDIIRWNMDKRYLMELEAEGIELIPTEFVFNHEDSIFERALRRGWNKIVLKPMISAGSYHTFVLQPNEYNRFRALIAEHYTNRPYLLQEFIPEIQQGEVSTLSFANGFIYSITKVPQEGDYRVQFNYGGKYHVSDVHPHIQALSEKIRNRFNNRTLYQRVDGVWRNGRFLLMEVELIEPDLYLGHDPEALEAWVNNLILLNNK